MSEPRQFRRDPATGGFREDTPLSHAEEAELTRLRAEIDADWTEPGRCAIPVDDDDASEPDAPTDLELSGTAVEHPELPPVSDPPGGSD